VDGRSYYRAEFPEFRSPPIWRGIQGGKSMEDHFLAGRMVTFDRGHSFSGGAWPWMLHASFEDSIRTHSRFSWQLK